MLREFVEKNREEILGKARLRVSARNAPTATEVELEKGLPIFLDQLGAILSRASSHEAHRREPTGGPSGTSGQTARAS